MPIDRRGKVVAETGARTKEIGKRGGDGQESKCRFGLRIHVPIVTGFQRNVQERNVQESVPYSM